MCCVLVWCVVCICGLCVVSTVQRGVVHMYVCIGCDVYGMWYVWQVLLYVTCAVHATSCTCAV